VGAGGALSFSSARSQRLLELYIGSDVSKRRIGLMLWVETRVFVPDCRNHLDKGT
jgi:hypothetical protein